MNLPSGTSVSAGNLVPSPIRTSAPMREWAPT